MSWKILGINSGIGFNTVCANSWPGARVGAQAGDRVDGRYAGESGSRVVHPEREVSKFFLFLKRVRCGEACRPPLEGGGAAGPDPRA